MSNNVRKCSAGTRKWREINGEHGKRKRELSDRTYIHICTYGSSRYNITRVLIGSGKFSHVSARGKYFGAVVTRSLIKKYAGMAAIWNFLFLTHIFECVFTS